MDSARIYTSVSKDAFTYQRSVKKLSVDDFTQALNGAYQDVNKKKTNDSVETDDNTSENENDALSGNSESSLEYLKGKFNEISTNKVTKVSKQEEDLKSAIRYMLLNLLLMLLIGKNGGDSENFFSKAFSSEGMSGEDLMSSSVAFTQVSERLAIEHYENEYEETSFCAKGIVRTADGRQIDFGIDVLMSRSVEKYAKETGVFDTIQMRLCDPLVINLDSFSADISDQKFFFDLDADGEMDSLSMLGKNSGFLALDLNEDGEINDGTELFGTKSGDGFKDLAKYDTDGNGWIDEADEIFDKLSIMCFNEDGTKSLYKLKDKDVGAIYLGNKQTEFSMVGQENKINAQVRKTGLFLYESGMAGSIQHVDLALEKGEKEPMSFSA